MRRAVCARTLPCQRGARDRLREASKILGAPRRIFVPTAPLDVHHDADPLPGIDDPGGVCVRRFSPKAAGEFDLAGSRCSTRLHFPMQNCESCGGLFVSSTAQNGIDQTKSADVAI
jgi:hypothetical protein